MGCSASRSSNFIQNPTADSSSSVSNSQLQSPFTDPSLTLVSRTMSLPTPLVHHPPLRKGDSNHFVALTSTTYGSLVIVDSPNPSFGGQDPAGSSAPGKLQDFGNSEDPLSPDSVINTWELMEGLDEDEEEEFHYHIVDKDHLPKTSEITVAESYEIVQRPHSILKPLWQHLSEESKFEPADDTPQEIGPSNSTTTDYRIVLYYTSLRGIRKTYEDCCTVRTIFQGFKVCVDEKDISMDRSYRTELQDALNGKPMRLPQVFIRGKHIGSADEIRHLNETGELAKMLETFPTMNLRRACTTCGDARFVPCPNCNGSRKVYEKERGGLRKCLECNENGLVRCNGCCP